MLHAQIGIGHIHVVFGVVRNLAVPDLLDMIFIDKFTYAIFNSEGKIVSYNSSPMPILTVHETKTDRTEEQQKNTFRTKIAEQYFNQKLVRVVYTVILKPLSQTSILLATNAKSMVQLNVFT